MKSTVTPILVTKGHEMEKETFLTDGYDKLPPTELKGLGKVPTQ